MSSAREAALKALSAFRRSGTWPQEALDDAIARGGLDSRDAALCQKICRGVLRNMFFLDWHIERISSRSRSKIEPQIMDILRLSAYQILFLNRVPVPSAVDEGVKLAKKTGTAAAGFVNAVLHRLASEKDRLPDVRCKTRAETLAVRFSHPVWLVEELLERLGEEECVHLLEADGQEPELTLQVNRLKTSAAAVLESIKPYGAYPHPWLPDAFVISGAGKLSGLAPVLDGSVWIQDAAARTAVKAAGAKPGMFVLDVCAAPGGKSFAAAVDMDNNGEILSCDIAGKKLPKIREGAERLGITILRTEARDATAFHENTLEHADIVFVDVPCSGFGTLRKNPDVRYKRREDVLRLPEVQYSILTSSARAVKQGGVLLYSTCTIRESENESVVKNFLIDHRDFHLEPFPTPFAEVHDGFFTFWPHIHGTDGFFVAKLRRNG